jgi:hypothetical protein
VGQQGGSAIPNEKAPRPQGFREAPLPGFEPGFPD